MKCKAAVLHGLGQEWQIEELSIEPPRAGEVLVQWKVAGMCHSDEHFVTGDMVPPAEMLEAAGIPPFFPIIGGHEGAGVVVDVGPGVTSVAPGDHVSAESAMWNKEIKGTIFGSLNPHHDIPKLLGLYRDGSLKLDELITRRYTLDEINVGYQAMRNGENIRGVIMYD